MRTTLRATQRKRYEALQATPWTAAVIIDADGGQDALGHFATEEEAKQALAAEVEKATQSMSKPVEGGMSGISEQLRDLFKGAETLGEEIARRATTTVIPAQSDFELLSLECAGEVCRRPIVGWAVTKGSYAGACTIGPIALGLTGSALAVGDAGYAIQCPDGRVLTMDASSRFYKDCRAWARAVNKAAATQAWDDAGQPTAGKA